MENGPRDERDLSVKKELSFHVEAMHNLHLFIAIEVEPGSRAAVHLRQLKAHLDRVTDAICR
jgi:hypothetical protein